MIGLFIFSLGGGIFLQGTVAKAIEGQQINAEDLNAECSAYDSSGILYFSNGNSIYKYKDNDISKVFDISSGDKFTIDQNNIIRIYNSEGCYKEESLKTNGESSLQADQQQQVVTQSKTSLEEDSKSYSISYSANVEGDGWQEVKNNGQTAGTTGECKRIEALEIKIVKETQIEGVSGRITAVQMRLVKDKLPPKIKYQSYVDGVFQEYVYDSAISGTTGQAKKIEGLKIAL